MIVEVADTTLAKDLAIAGFYLSHGIRLYYLVSIRQQLVTQFTPQSTRTVDGITYDNKTLHLNY